MYFLIIMVNTYTIYEKVAINKKNLISVLRFKKMKTKIDYRNLRLYIVLTRTFIKKRHSQIISRLYKKIKYIGNTNTHKNKSNFMNFCFKKKFLKLGDVKCICK